MSGKRRNTDLLNLAIVLGALILLGYVSTFFFARFDLTSEKRYTLTDSTKDLLGELDDVIYVRVYLEGELPAGFRRLRDRTREMLDEFRAYGDQQIEYEFINPAANDEASNRQLQEQLIKLGVEPTNIQIRQGDGMTTKMVFPGAVMTYQGEEIPLQLLKSRLGASPEEMLNSSMEDLEYELVNAVRKLILPITDRIAFISGHNELTPQEVVDMTTSLTEYYGIDRINLDGNVASLVSRAETDSGIIVFPNYKAIIIAKPDTAFEERDKFLIDQYIMYGGRVLWLIEPVHCNMDSLQFSPTTYALPIESNLNDMLFKYGVRVNTDIIQDARCAQIPGPSGYVGQQLQWALQPWIFFPIMIPEGEHPIVRNLNGIKMEFASTIDTVYAPKVKKTVLLQSSTASRILQTPARVSLDVMARPPKPEQFNKPNLHTAVLLEGEFESAYKNRITAELMSAKEIAYRENSRKTKMVVISDGDVMKNHVRTDGSYMPLGYDRYTSQTFGNKKFLLNAINYLCDDDDLISNRSRSLEIRLLDTKKADSERTFWQVINVGLPLVLLILFGIINSFLRKRRYSA